MTVDETATLYGPRLQSFRMPLLRGCVFECRPISIAPERMVAIMYRRDGDTLHQAGVASVKEGRWFNTAGKPLEGDYFWTLMADDPK